MKLIQRRNWPRRGPPGRGARPASGWRSASHIRMAALSVMTSPSGVVSTGIWRIGLIPATLSRSVSPSQVTASTTR